MDFLIAKVVQAGALSLLLVVLGFAGAYANETIKGRVEAGDIFIKLARPVKTGPKEAQTESLRAFSKPAAQQLKGMGAVIDSSDFILGGKTSEFAKEICQQDGKTILTKEDKDLVIAWENWHKAVSELIYSHWRNLGTVPGEAKVKLTFSKDREVTVEFLQYFAHDDDEINEFYSREAFEASINKTLRSLNHDLALAFPAKSQRTIVVLNTKFSSHMNFGPSGYSWKKDDYEHVSSPSH